MNLPLRRAVERQNAPDLVSGRHGYVALPRGPGATKALCRYYRSGTSCRSLCPRHWRVQDH